MQKHILFTLLCSLLLLACGGSGSDSSPSTRAPSILVNAGSDIIVAEGDSVALTGVASGGNSAYNFAWTSSANIIFEQLNADQPDATLVAPVVTEETNYTLTLTATDADGASGSRSITLTVTPINITPVANILPNTIDNYPSQHYPVFANIVLDGSSSFDEDPQTSDADITAYLWQQVAGDDVLENAVVDAAILRFTAPLALGPASIDIILTVTDQEGAQAEQRISLNLVGEQGTLPVASTGRPVAVFSGEQMPLTALASSVAPNAQPFSFMWKHDFPGVLPIDIPNQNNTVAQAPLVNETTEISFELIATDAFNNQANATVGYIVYPPQRLPINDTGVILSANETGFQASYLNDFPGQDAQFGSDRINESSLLNKTGRGENGFDFTRLNENGDPVDDTSRPWRCVRDNVTGLVWETKNTLKDNIHFSDQGFTWYQEEDNGNFEGELNIASDSCNLDSQECNTASFVQEVNQNGLCGFFDWRLPSHTELQSILHYGKSVSYLLDSEYFPFAATVPQEPIWYWTNQSSADGVNDDVARNAWAIDFASGVDNFLNKTSERRVRLVRAGRSNL